MRYLAVYSALFATIAVTGFCLFSVFVQSRLVSGDLWARHAAARYYAAFRQSGEEGADFRRNALFGQARAGLLKALENDPYNTDYWMRYILMQKQYEASHITGADVDAYAAAAPDAQLEQRQMERALRITAMLAPSVDGRQSGFIFNLDDARLRGGGEGSPP